jgi:hypothetical protein
MDEMKRGDSHTFIFNSPVALPSIARLSFSYSPDPILTKYVIIQKLGVLSDDNKELTFNLLPDDTAKLRPGTLYREVEFTTDEGRVATLELEPIKLIADITVKE